MNVAVGDEEVEMANRALEDVLDSFVLRKDEIEVHGRPRLVAVALRWCSVRVGWWSAQRIFV